MLSGFGLTRAHPNGFGLFGVFASPPDDPFGGKNLLLAQGLSGLPTTVFEEGVDYGDGVVQTIPGNGVSNINRNGQFIVEAILEGSGDTALYRIQIGPDPPVLPNRVGADWMLYR